MFNIEFSVEFRAESSRVFDSVEGESGKHNNKNDRSGAKDINMERST